MKNQEEADLFVSRHIGPRDEDLNQMLSSIGCESLDDLSDRVVPASIRRDEPLALEGPQREVRTLERLRSIASKNVVARSYIGLGYHGTLTPPVILRNVLENPGWYTQYTPYQAEIAQGRLEALLNFQTMVADLTGLPMANASLLDEATAAAEAMAMCRRLSKSKSNRFFVAEDCHPQTLEVLRTRSEPLGLELVIGALEEVDFASEGGYFGLILQSPSTDGRLLDFTDLATAAHDGGCLVVAATDLLALTLIASPGTMGADIAIGSTQRFGMPMGYGGPHAAFIAASMATERQLPGRIVGMSKDSAGAPALRLARQTREQHIRRERATSNICTAQVLPAVVASMYAVYHGPEGLRAMASKVHRLTCQLAEAIRGLGLSLGESCFFDTVRIVLGDGEAARLTQLAAAQGMNLRTRSNGSVQVSLDETVSEEDLVRLVQVLAEFAGQPAYELPTPEAVSSSLPPSMQRQDAFMTHPVFSSYRSEHQMLRYLNELQEKDLSLTHSMIPLGSCTMKLNATAEMMPITWPELAHLHPFAPRDQVEGYARMFELLEQWLAEITGFEAVSLQPNAGSQGEFAGLLAIRGYHQSAGCTERNVCLIPTSAHGTNPASAVMAGMKVVAVRCREEDGSIDLDDLRAKAELHQDALSALMVTYPSTHGVFEDEIREVCEIVHEFGGLVYMDGANMNAQVGLCRPGDIGADVCHLNLHKTFCIPHGGGGPGMGPICVNGKLAPFLPRHPLAEDPAGVGAVASTSHGSGLILAISWMFIAMMGASGLRRASQVAILNANYMARRLASDYDVLFSGDDGWVAHEFILDFRAFKDSAGVTVDDVAKRLIDYGFHAPTMSWPVAGTMMIEPTESESLDELDRFCDAMIAIREEIRQIEQGEADRESNVLKGAPHTAFVMVEEPWSRPYTREQAVFPAPWVRRRKFWPAVGRVNNAYGDRNLVCTCGTVESYAEPELAKS